MRVYKKYDNRRLYCMTEGRYVRVEDIGGVVLAGEDVKVIAKRDQRDITTSVLLQVVGDMVERGAVIVRPAEIVALIRRQAQA